MALIFLLAPIFKVNSENSPLRKYQQHLFENAENLDNYKEGMVFFESREEDVLFGKIIEGPNTYWITCEGHSTTKKTILLSGRDDDLHFGQNMDDRYYLLEEETFWLNASDSNFNRCKENFGNDIIKTTKINLKKKNRISLREFKRVFQQKIYEIQPLKNNKIKIVREASLIPDDTTWCGRDPFKNKMVINRKNQKGDRFMPLMIIQDLNRPWDFAVERVFQIPINKNIYTRRRLSNIDPRSLDSLIMDVEVDLGSYSFLLTGGCKKEEFFPKKRWREIINWRSQ